MNAGRIRFKKPTPTAPPAQAAATKRAPHARTSKNDIIINEWSGISINGHE